MLQLFFAVAFSAAPLTLYVPPVRCLNLFIETMETFARESSGYTTRTLPRFSQAFRRILSALLRPFRSILVEAGYQDQDIRLGRPVRRGSMSPGG
ncbi:hypothetical protein HPP92_024883 [Vanilla planifolia]|uniref:Uncharacterized protein n=1 Tax=Vanilla planifolia TaxID=51239 RepID=A0A835UDP6_VANPL|nr:hypothetical protein HPP92_024883 [Vanilla planifolia]